MTQASTMSRFNPPEPVNIDSDNSRSDPANLPCQMFASCRKLKSETDLLREFGEIQNVIFRTQSIGATNSSTKSSIGSMG